jgi:hypothetical protein
MPFDNPMTSNLDSIPSTSTTRAGRQVRATWKLRDQLPEGDGIVDESELSIPSTTIENAPSSSRRVVLLLSEQIRTAANRFGLSRLYKRRPVQKPDPSINLDKVFTPTEAQQTATRPKRAIHQIIAPYPNLSSFLFDHHHWLAGHKKTQDNRDSLRDLLVRDDFNNSDLKGVNFKKLDLDLASNDIEAPWIHDGEGWQHAAVTIRVPLMKRQTQASRREAASEQQRISRGEGLSAFQDESSAVGEPLTIPGLWYKDICSEIKNTFEHDEAAKNFVFDPYLMYHSRPNSTDGPEPVYSELFSSKAVVDEDIRLQNSPREPGCDLPRALVMMMYWSDSTHVTQFGHSKVWPAYLFYGNQTKYESSRPTCHAAHHIAYFPSVSNVFSMVLLWSFKPRICSFLMTYKIGYSSSLERVAQQQC